MALNGSVHVDGQLVVAALCVGMWLAVVAAGLVMEWRQRRRGGGREG